jgi:hypothetical protein
MRITTVLLIAGFALSAGCARTLPSDNDGQDAGPGAGGRENDWSAIVKLEDEAKAIAKTNGCSAGSQCRTAPVGSRACGGPRYYITYCSASTDSAALYRKLDEVAKAERAYNTKYGIASTCEFRMPPAVGLVAGECKEK